jgi:hypothetical protein
MGQKSFNKKGAEQADKTLKQFLIKSRSYFRFLRIILLSVEAI